MQLLKRLLQLLDVGVPWCPPTGLTYLGTGPDEGNGKTRKYSGKPKNLTKKLHGNDTVPVFITTSSSNPHSCKINLRNT